MYFLDTFSSLSKPARRHYKNQSLFTWCSAPPDARQGSGQQVRAPSPERAWLTSCKQHRDGRLHHRTLQCLEKHWTQQGNLTIVLAKVSYSANSFIKLLRYV